MQHLYPHSHLKGVPAFSYLSPNTEQIPVVTDIRNLLRHSPNSTPDPRSAPEKTSSNRNGEQVQKCPSHFYQYHQHLQYQPQHPPKEGSWTSSPEQAGNRKHISSHSPVQNQKSSNQQSHQKSSMFSFNFLNKTKDQGTPKKDDRSERREKENANKEKRKDKKRSGETESRLIENYLSNPQRSKKFGLTLQQQYFQSQQQKLQQQKHQVASRRILESHSYQNVSDEDRQRQSPPPPVKEASPGGNQQQMFRKFGDTNLMPRNSPGSNVRKSGCHVENGIYRYSPHITSFAELEYVNRNSADYEHKGNFNISKYLNIDIKSASNSSAYSSGSNMSPPSKSNLSANKASNRSSPNLHQHDSNSSSSSLLSDKSSCSTSSLDQRSYFIGEPHEYGSYLGPFNFRQLLRPTQGPTESLRKRKGVNTNSPPPPQRGKSFM